MKKVLKEQIKIFLLATPLTAFWAANFGSQNPTYPAVEIRPGRISQDLRSISFEAPYAGRINFRDTNSDGILDRRKDTYFIGMGRPLPARSIQKEYLVDINPEKFGYAQKMFVK